MDIVAMDEAALVLARLEVKLDQLLAVSGDHESRIRRLEDRRWPLPVLASIVATLSMVGTIAALWVKL